jgi:arginase
MADVPPRHAAEGWTAVGCPFDCSASGRGEELSPAALRRTDFLRRAGIVDAGDVHPTHVPAGRDPATGILAQEQIVGSSRRIRQAVGRVYERNRLPLVLGGDCGCLLGAAAAAGNRFGRIGLVLVDGHADYWDGRTSETGEIADMSTAVLNGWGPDDLAGLAGARPMVMAGHTLLLGYRDDPDIPAGAQQERDRVPAVTQIVTGRQLREPAAVPLIRDAVARLGADTSGLWLHIDVDVLDETVMPAVTYPKGDGPDFEQLTAALGPVAASPRLIGISVADLRPDLDPDGSHTAHVRDLVTTLLTGGVS